jgi:hypothetical protein
MWVFWLVGEMEVFWWVKGILVVVGVGFFVYDIVVEGFI